MFRCFETANCNVHNPYSPDLDFISTNLKDYSIFLKVYNNR